MTILVDECHWWWRGRRWCHLVSDRDLDELHAFAERLGIPRRAFQGDHYDVHEDGRAAAIALGAHPVASRDLVRRLRAAGLRLTPAQRRAVTHHPGDLAEPPPDATEPPPDAAEPPPDATEPPPTGGASPPTPH